MSTTPTAYVSSFTALAGHHWCVQSAHSFGAHAVSIHSGSLALFLEADEATALGTHLIAAADHYRKAARAAETVAEGA